MWLQVQAKMLVKDKLLKWGHIVDSQSVLRVKWKKKQWTICSCNVTSPGNYATIG